MQKLFLNKLNIVNTKLLDIEKDIPKVHTSGVRLSSNSFVLLISWPIKIRSAYIYSKIEIKIIDLPHLIKNIIFLDLALCHFTSRF